MRISILEQSSLSYCISYIILEYLLSARQSAGSDFVCCFDCLVAGSGHGAFAGACGGGEEGGGGSNKLKPPAK